MLENTCGVNRGATAMKLDIVVIGSVLASTIRAVAIPDGTTQLHPSAFESDPFLVFANSREVRAPGIATHKEVEATSKVRDSLLLSETMLKDQ